LGEFIGLIISNIGIVAYSEGNELVGGFNPSEKY
jgi:hypothetical protein